MLLLGTVRTLVGMKRGQVIIEDFESELLRSNPLGDPAVRKLAIYLPPSYSITEDRRYPVIVLLSGFMGFGTMFLSPQAWGYSIDERCDRLIADGRMDECIVVMPDCFTKYGGSQYVNSSAQGPYEDYLMNEILPHVDGSYRTKGVRGVMGKSSGGFAALRLGMRYPDTFRVVFCSSGDMYFEYAYKPDIPKCYNAISRYGGLEPFLVKFYESPKKSRDMIDAINIVAMSASYSPNPSAPLGFDLPFDERTGRLRQDVWEKWLTFDPVDMIRNPLYLNNLKKLSKLFMECGSRDEYHLHIGARIFTSILKSYDIPFWYEEFDDGHMNTSYRYDQSLSLVSQAIR